MHPPLFIGLGLVLMLTACASDEPRHPGDRGATSTPTEAPSTRSGANAKAARPCVGADPEVLALAEPTAGNSLTNLRLKVLIDGEPHSLCNVLAESGRAAAIFQFAGVTCLSCQEEATFFGGAVTPGGDAEGLAHVIVVTDFLEDYTEDEFAAFMAKFAPDSIRVHDDHAQMWKHFSVDPTLPIRPTLVAMNLYQRFILVNNEGADYHDVIEPALALLRSPAEE